MPLRPPCKPENFADRSLSELTIRDFFAAVSLHAMICKGTCGESAGSMAYDLADLALSSREDEDE